MVDEKNEKEKDANSIAKDYFMEHRINIENEDQLQEHLRKIKKMYPEVGEDKELEILVCKALIRLRS